MLINDNSVPVWGTVKTHGKDFPHVSQTLRVRLTFSRVSLDLICELPPSRRCPFRTTGQQANFAENPAPRLTIVSRNSIYRSAIVGSIHTFLYFGISTAIGVIGVRVLPFPCMGE